MNDADREKVKENSCLSEPQCQFFVTRKKRLCRMTVKPGRNYCGEHAPQPQTDEGQDDSRVPCPNDPKHTCYASKLDRHLAVCNARQLEVPDYIIHNINAPQDLVNRPRTMLNQVPQDKIQALIAKVNMLYDKHVKDNITTIAEQPIHEAVIQEFSEKGRTESSLRHLRQVSSLLHLIEAEGLVQDGTCYVELGAGRGHLSYYAHRAWCARGASGVLLVDRASPRHKRDNKLRAAGERVRADLAHLALRRVPAAAAAPVVALAKHLCGVATDYALRCLAACGAAGGAGSVRGAVLATCCHHRCEPAAYVATDYLQELGIGPEELNIILGLVSWATCGSGRSRGAGGTGGAGGAGEGRAAAGARAKALLDAGRAHFLRGRGFRARLVRFVPAGVTPENVCIVAAAPVPGSDV